MKNRLVVLLTAATVASAAAPVLAEQNELMAIWNTTRTDSSFAMLSYRRDLQGDPDSGAKLRFDAGYGEYPLIGDDGSFSFTRLGVAYAIETSAWTTVTLTGGFSHRWRSPEDTSVSGVFASVELFNTSASGNDLFLLGEYDSVDQTYLVSGRYLLDMNSFSVGPTASYLEEGDYSRRAAGVSGSFDLSPSAELSITGAWAEQQVGASPTEDASYIELQIRTTF